MRVDAFDFDLPEDRIALRPVVPRDAAKLLQVSPDGGLIDRYVRDLPDVLQPGDILVVNDTQVIPARLWGFRDQVKVECLLLQRLSPDQWRAFARPGKRLKTRSVIRFADSLEAEVTEKLDDGQVTLTFNRTAGDLDAAIAQQGEMPLPPYIAGKRPADTQDKRDYQTLFAQQPGAVAAPTAGLHFTDDLLRRLDDRGVKHVTLTLHVGAGTFLPVKADDTGDHKMHAEWGQITPQVADLLNETRAAGGRIVAVGTTSLRLLESATDALGTIRPFSGDTDIFITPGYQFRAVDILLTNFHLPKSTLFMLVSAFSGLQVMQRAYAHAIGSGYRFYSYGDACLLIR